MSRSWIFSHTGAGGRGVLCCGFGNEVTGGLPGILQGAKIPTRGSAATGFDDILSGIEEGAEYVPVAGELV
jgi:hypothetical protein